MRRAADPKALAALVDFTGAPIGGLKTSVHVAVDTTAGKLLNNYVYMLPRRQFVSANVCSHRKQGETQCRLTAISAVCVIDAAS